MPQLSAAEIAEAMGGRLLQGDPQAVFTGYHFDSRQVQERMLFFALVTPSGDGHTYLEQVAAKAGAGAVVERARAPRGLTLPLIEVDDSAAAYWRLAARVRERCTSTRFVGLSGSAGKTTTREFAHQILGHRYRSFRSPGNWNNWLGLPFALLAMSGDEEVAVFELAMSSPGLGEIDRLAGLLRPDITCLLNVLPVHLEFLKTMDNVARAKLEINNHLSADGLALVNGDYELLRSGTRGLAARTLYFGRDPAHNQVVLREVRRENGRCRLFVDLAGSREELLAPPLTDAQVDNLLAAAAIAWQVGMSLAEIQTALGRLEPLAGRGRVTEHAGITFVDETYNSNPEAAKKLLRWAVAQFTGFRAAVLGDMLELGEGEARFHAEVGEVVAELGFDLLVTVGERARLMAEAARAAGMATARVASFATPEEAAAFLAPRLERGSVVLLKASRGVRLERALQALLDQGE